MPFKGFKNSIFLRIIRLSQFPRVMFYRLLSSARVKGNARFLQPAQLTGQGLIEFGRQVTIGFFPSPYFFSTYAYIEARYENAKVLIGDKCFINNAFTAIAEHTTIKIGERVLIGTGVEIYDSDFHGLKVEDRNKSNPMNAKPVVIEEDVFIGSNVRILKGVKIGIGSVIANSSLVLNDIPEFVLAGGSPARLIRKLNV